MRGEGLEMLKTMTEYNKKLLHLTNKDLDLLEGVLVKS